MYIHVPYACADLWSRGVALLTLEKSLLTIKSIVKSLKIDPESTLQHLTLGPSTPGKFWIWAWYLSPFFKKKIALSYFMPI